MEVEEEEVEEEVTQEQYKVIVVGDPSVGKTSTITRFVDGAFSDEYKSTIGGAADFALKEIEWEEDVTIHLQLWDIGGQERFRSMTRVYYKESDGVCIVFDLTERRTFEAVARWKSDVDGKITLSDGTALPAFLFANKADLGDPAVSDAEIEALAREHRFVGWCKTSAKTGQNIDEGIQLLLRQVVLNAERIDGELSMSYTREDTDELPSTRSFKLRKLEKPSDTAFVPEDDGCCA